MDDQHAPTPTVVDFPNFDAMEDAVKLGEAIEKIIERDDQTIIDILTKRSNSQRQAIAAAYREQYDRVLIDDLNSEVNICSKAYKIYQGYHRVIKALMLPPEDYLTKELHKFLFYIPDTETIAEILCPMTNQYIAVIGDTFFEKYDQTLEGYMHQECKKKQRTIRDLFSFIITGKRREDTDVDQERAREVAKALHEAEVAYCEPFYRAVFKWCNNKSLMCLSCLSCVKNQRQRHEDTNIEKDTDALFIKTFARESYAQLRQVFVEYKNIAGKDIEEGIKAMEFDDELEKVLCTIVVCARDGVVKWFAECLHAAIQGLGTDDYTLVRIVVSRSEIDLGAIKTEYERLYGTTLQKDVEG